MRKSGWVLAALLGLCLAGARHLPAANPPYLVYGYLGDWDGVTAAQMPWNSLTHVMDAFALPSATGTLSKTPNTTMITAAHANGKKIMLSIGGASSNNTNWQSSTNATYLNTFVANIMNMVAANNYDGVDIDWEFPTAAYKTQFMSLMQKLWSACTDPADPNWKGSAKELTFFISPGYAICGVDWATIGNYCTYGILGGYDFTASNYGMTFNGPIDTAQTFTDCLGTSRKLSVKSTVDKLATLGLAKSKIILAMPLYQVPSYANVEAVVCSGTYTTHYSPEYETKWGSNTEAVTDSWAFCQKMNWAAGYGLAGFSLWEIAYGVPVGSCTELQNIWATLAGTSGCLSFLGSPTPSPTLSPALSPTPTASPSATRSPTPTRSPTRTATASASPSATRTDTPTATPSPSPSATRTDTPTATPSPSPSATRTPSASPGPSGTPTTTRTASPSASPSASASPTRTPSLSPTETATRSESPTAGPSETASPTRTDSPTPGPSATATPSFTTSPSFSASPSRTQTPTASPSFTISPTFSPGGAAAQPRPLSLLPVPNPQGGGAGLALALELEAPADAVTLQLYSPAMVLLQSEELAGPWPGGWRQVSSGLRPPAGGLYYLLALARREGRLYAGAPSKLYWLR